MKCLFSFFALSVAALFPTVCVTSLHVSPDAGLPFKLNHFAMMPFAASLQMSAPSSTLLFPKALDLLSLEAVPAHSFFQLWPALFKKSNQWHQRPG